MTADVSDDAAADSGLRIRLGAGAAIAVVFLVLRMLAVAHWDWHAVAAIADTFDFSDAFPIAFGTVVGQPVLTGVFVAVLLPLVAMHLCWPMSGTRGPVTVSSIMGAVLLVTIAVSLTVTFGNPWTILGAAAVGAVLVGLRLWRRSGRVHDLLRALLHRIGLLAVGAILLLAVVNDAPWMGREQISTRDGVIDGYVLEASPGFLHVLTDDRDVIIVPDAQVTGRELE